MKIPEMNVIPKVLTASSIKPNTALLPLYPLENPPAARKLR
jgi:hypothetical protein